MTSNDVYPRRVLFAVTGMSPQVVTETLWALIEERNVVPTEIRLVTTLPGRECAVRDLLHPIEGMFHRLCKDLHLTGRNANCLTDRGFFLHSFENKNNLIWPKTTFFLY